MARHTGRDAPHTPQDGTPDESPDGAPRRGRRDPRRPEDAYLAFWRERHLCTLTTLRPDGTPHVVPVGVTYDPEAGVARIITRRSSTKVANVSAAADRPGGARAAVCQVDRGRWATLEGTATVRTDPEAVADAEARYAERYHRVPSPNPERVVIEIAVDRAMGGV
ncbi:TIGR03618 family F420-dependent PPOX class oxidoreductase [Streptomyces sp. TRM43335]|uniref:TIGR03618 family F420-dependent PPOX class oxidoreductase n=1 Tax=Streptomyces taklimakanensis TaxID=2569853 RepID=A0A6G2BC43_9ACTN|nr:TIGR03618 family F420-dependent PPOX class oxidoreductase [Streptomyces taklimakanensis]MTE19845.1 TIGR03618 family F420-dependent PPOX class oxidoreductase [Streptomyces taklimakanensis]